MAGLTLGSLLPRFDPSASLDFLWACIHVPRIWQGRDQRTPQAGPGCTAWGLGRHVCEPTGPSGLADGLPLQKRREELALRVQAPELLGLVELILAEAESRSQDGDLLQARLPLLLSCCRGEDDVRRVTAHLTGCVQQRGDR